MSPFAKGVVTGVVLTVVGGVLLLVAVAALGYVPANADDHPSWAERRLAGLARSSAVKRLAPTDANPIPLSDANLMAGMELYRTNCQGCHGGPDDAGNPFGQAMYPSIPQFPARSHPIGMSEQQLYWIGKHGFRLTGMPSFTHLMKDEDLWKTALFIKHMSQLPPAVEQAWKAPPTPAH